jgi:hypothetical protein
MNEIIYKIDFVKIKIFCTKKCLGNNHKNQKEKLIKDPSGKGYPKYIVNSEISTVRNSTILNELKF